MTSIGFMNSGARQGRSVSVLWWEARRAVRVGVVVGALCLVSRAMLAADGTAGAPGKKASTVDKPPPDPWIRHGLYPGGFETVGPWTAHRRTPLYQAPGSPKIVAHVEACEEITVDETELRGRPRELRVLKANPPLFRKGERMWILAHDLEEGYEELWYRGEIRDDVEVSLEEALSSSEESCTSPSPKCWLWLAKEQPQALWIRMRRKDGTRGWSTRAEEDFTEGSAKPGPCPQDAQQSRPGPSPHHPP
jgi:hypothetical protein